MFNNAQTLRTLRASPPQPGLAMDVGKDAIWVTDLNLNALIASAWLAQVTATPAENRTYVFRAGTWTTPVLVARVPGLQPLTIGCPDSPESAWPRVSYSAAGVNRNVSRFSWRGEVYQENQPEYVVSGADWLTLVEKFGLAPQLEDTANNNIDIPARRFAPAVESTAYFVIGEALTKVTPRLATSACRAAVGLARTLPGSRNCPIPVSRNVGWQLAVGN
jgi:hypothetical protein